MSQGIGYNNQQKPLSLGNTAFNTATATRASNVASGQRSNNINKAASIGKQQASGGADKIQQQRFQMQQDREQKTQDSMFDMQTALRYAKEDIEDQNKAMIQTIINSQQQFDMMKQQDRVAMQNNIADFRTAHGTEAAANIVGGAVGTIAAGIGSAKSGSNEGGGSALLSAKLGTALTGLPALNKGSSVDGALSPLGSQGYGAPESFQPFNNDFQDSFKGNIFQDQVNAANLVNSFGGTAPPIHEVYGDYYGQNLFNPSSNQLFNSIETTYGEEY